MRAFLQRLWALPWPPALRELASHLVTTPILRLFFIPQFMVGVVGIIVDEERRLLLLRHTYRTEHPWGLPSGFLEHGEQPDAALRREIKEETGFAVRLTDGPQVYTSAERPFVNIIYTGVLEGGSFRSDAEISEARLFRADELPGLEATQDLLVRQFYAEDSDARADGMHSKLL